MNSLRCFGFCGRAASLFAAFLLLALGAAQASTPLTPGFGRRIGDFVFSADGQRVLFTAQSSANGPHPYELFSTPVGGGPILPVTPAPADPDHDVFPFALSPDGQTIVYRQADHPDEGNLFRISTTGGVVTQLTTTDDVSGSFTDPRFWLTPSGDRVIYIRHFLKGNPNPRDTRDLMSVPVDGHAPPVQLNSDLAGLSGSVTDVSLLPSGQHVIYGADQDLEARRDLFRTSVAGGLPVRINDVAGPRQNALIRYVVNAAGDSVVYRTNGASPTSRQRLYATPVFNGAETPLATALPAAVDVDHFEYSADERHVLFTTDDFTANKHDLFSAPVDGGPMVRLTAGSPAGLGVDDASVTPLEYGGKSMVAFRTHDSDGSSSFYLGAVDDPNPSLLGRLQTPGGIVPPFSLRVTPQGDHLFVHNSSSTAPYAYLFPLNGDPMIPLGLMTQSLFHPDGVHLIYSSGGFNNASQLYWQRIGAPASAVPITDEHALDDIAYFLLSGDGATVLYKRGLYSGSPQNLYVAPVPVPEPSAAVLCVVVCCCCAAVRRGLQEGDRTGGGGGESCPGVGRIRDQPRAEGRNPVGIRWRGRQLSKRDGARSPGASLTLSPRLPAVIPPGSLLAEASSCEASGPSFASSYGGGRKFGSWRGRQSEPTRVLDFPHESYKRRRWDVDGRECGGRRDRVAG